jgi:TetR/AcrR family transcriptional regulator, transcriptional repressor of bet genes
MDGTIQSMAENGVASTTVQTICTAAGVSRGLISHYFDSKEALVAEAFRYLFGKVSYQVRNHADVLAATSPVAQLYAMPVALFSADVFTQTNRNAFLSFWHEIRFNPLVQTANKEIYQDYIRRIEILFRKASTEHNVTIDSHRAALGLIALSDGLWLGLSTHYQVAYPQQAIDLCQIFIDGQLGGATS